MVWPSWDIPWHTLRLTTSTPYTNGFSLRASCFFRSTSRRRFTQCFATRHLPISIDIMLSDQHCDLLNPKQQAQWLPWARQGAIHMAIGGPPCETWSVSRLRWHEEPEGSRSLRNGSRLENHIWGLPQLRIQEARQVRVANSLLHFCILPMIRQSASTVFPIHIKQGYWNAISPKPKLLLTTIPATCGSNILEYLEGFRVPETLPPPLKMGRTSRKTFNTAVLKRYPCAFCRSIAEIAGKFAMHVPYIYSNNDVVLLVAQSLRRIYVTSDDALDDGEDYAGDRNEFGAPKISWVSRWTLHA